MIDINVACEKALMKWGSDNQILQSVEELSELTAILLQSRRSNRKIDNKSVLEEIADVEIMITQLKIIFQEDKKLAASNFDNEYTAIFNEKAHKFYKHLEGA